MAQQRQTHEIDARIAARAEKISLLLLDVDGVLTNGLLTFSNDGAESKVFNTQDGFGIRLLQDAGIDVGVITARKSAAVAMRCENLNMRYVYQGDSNKLNAYNEIMEKSSLKPFEVCYMGDDWLDLILLNRVGLAAAPANAVAEVLASVHLVTDKSGGEGAVREVCDVILKAKKLHEKLLQRYSAP